MIYKFIEYIEPIATVITSVIACYFTWKSYNDNTGIEFYIKNNCWTSISPMKYPYISNLLIVNKKIDQS